MLPRSFKWGSVTKSQGVNKLLISFTLISVACVRCRHGGNAEFSRVFIFLKFTCKEHCLMACGIAVIEFC